MSRLVYIQMWCPAARETVKLECKAIILHPSIQTIIPKICWKLRKTGCRFIEPLGKANKQCLLEKEIQGNFKELEDLL